MISATRPRRELLGRELAAALLHLSGQAPAEAPDGVAGVLALGSAAAGVLTDACVESSARHAAERGFQVTVVDDACAAWEPDFHATSLRNLARYFARVATTAAVVAELEAGQRGPARSSP